MMIIVTEAEAKKAGILEALQKLPPATPTSAPAGGKEFTLTVEQAKEMGLIGEGQHKL
jgi:hypothetical protein